MLGSEPLLDEVSAAGASPTCTMASYRSWTKSLVRREGLDVRGFHDLSPGTGWY